MAGGAQLGLFGKTEPEFDASFGKLSRTLLAPDAWFDYAPGWLDGHSAVFDELVKSTRFRSEQREMYERVVQVPRLYAVLPEDGPVPAVIEAARAALSRRYGEELSRVSLGYYRDGRDSVAFHGDYVARNLPNALVATISVGEPRRFLMRPKGGGRSLALMLGWGDLLVMGGSCQRTWDHGIPKVKRAGQRIAIMLRPVWREA